MALLNAVIDLSHHNTVSSFHRIKAGEIIGVVHKATQGIHFVDAEYADRRAAAISAGLLFGSYHFATRGDPDGQADHYLDTADSTDLMVLDFEPNAQDGTMTLAEAEVFVTRIHDQTGRFPGVYSGESFINGQLGNNTDTVLKECFLWIAKYSARRPRVPAAFRLYTLWQYTDGSAGPQPHTVSGVGRRGALRQGQVQRRRGGFAQALRTILNFGRHGLSMPSASIVNNRPRPITPAIRTGLMPLAVPVAP
jgi:lysozyme